MCRRASAAIGILALTVSLTACLPDPLPAPTVTSAPTVRATPSPSPTPSPTPTSSPTIPPAAEEDRAFTPAELIDACTQAQAAAGGAPDAVALDQARVLERLVEPHWFVYVPATFSYGAGAVKCIIGGTPGLPEYFLVSTTLPMTEDEIRLDLESNTQYNH